MSDALTTITNLIQSPPGQLAAGGVWQPIAVQFGVGIGLFYGVTKFFDTVGDRLTDDARLQIALWLVGRKKFQPKVEPWQDTFAEVFDRIFGRKHFSWKCFSRSALTSLVLALSCAVIVLVNEHAGIAHGFIANVEVLILILPFLIISNVIPDYVSLLKTRKLLKLMARRRYLIVWVLFIVVDLYVTIGIAFIGNSIMNVIARPMEFARRMRIVSSAVISFLTAPSRMFFIIEDEWRWENGLSIAFVTILPALFTSIWLWLYAVSGALLKAARRFDIGFDWFNRHFDIEKKPLQSIGLVAGTLVALVYWAAVIVGRVLG